MTSIPSVLFVCMGNICRSPAAEGLFASYVARQGDPDSIHIDSAGTHGFHVGNRADPRMREAAANRGYQLSSRARTVSVDDLQRFDLVLAMDRENLEHLHRLLDDDQPCRARVCLFSEFLGDEWPTDVPDPYYGGQAGFEMVLDMIQAACPALHDALLANGPQ